YQRAILIDPLRETAYRYSATPFMRQKKYDVARDRYIEAYITEPYNTMSTRGLGQWADVTGANLGHPKIEIPKESDAKNGEWEPYFIAKAAAEKAAPPARPGEMRLYRRNLKDESAAIRSVLAAAKDSGNVQIQVLQKLDKEGLLEPFILLALADQGLAQDHPSYLKENRAKLRQYVVSYVIQK
ncbi:MAG: hypothetical protein AB7J13_02455, partial [Pyrinomonadaceae bacterium]